MHWGGPSYLIMGFSETWPDRRLEREALFVDIASVLAGDLAAGAVGLVQCGPKPVERCPGQVSEKPT